MIFNLLKFCLIAAFMLWTCASTEKFGIDELEIKLGDTEGISATSTISQENLQKIISGVENGNKDNIYFYGLLKLYGISLSKDLATAAQNFQRASALGHKEATTAYGVMLMSGNGIKQDFAGALKYFRRGVELGDMVGFICYDLFGPNYYYLHHLHYSHSSSRVANSVQLFRHFTITSYFRMLTGCLESKLVRSTASFRVAVFSSSNDARAPFLNQFSARPTYNTHQHLIHNLSFYITK